MVEIKYFPSQEQEKFAGGMVAEIDEHDDPSAMIFAEPANIPELQRACPDLKDIILFLETGILPDDENQARVIALTADSYTIDDDEKLYHLHTPRHPGIWKVKGLKKPYVYPFV